MEYELYHHGIKGQQWGKRNGPPYPLDSNDHSKSEIKAGWKDSLKKGKEYHREMRDSKKEAVKQYYRDIKGGKPEYLAKENYKKLLNKIDNDLKEKYPDQAKRREIAKNIAKGVAIAAVVGATTYLVADSASYVNAIGVQVDITNRFGSDRAASIISDVMDKDISSLSDMDEIVTANTTLQRVIRDYGDTEKALSMEKAKDFIYATFDKNDNYIYQTLFNARGEGKKLITQRTVVNDLVMPSAMKRAKAFKELAKDENFLKALFIDINGYDPSKYKRDRLWERFRGNWTDGELFNQFSMRAGQSDSKSAPIYFKKIAEMGYNAIRDDNDSGYLGKQPIILLSASKDTVQSGHKAATHMNQMMARLKVSNIPKYDRKSIFS